MITGCQTCTYLLTVFTVLFGAGCNDLEPYRIYWGDVHGHTRHSDGRGDLDDYFTYARDVSGLDFVIVTDHDFGNEPPWRLPEETWRKTQEKADKYTVEGRFVAIAGYEWTSAPKYWTDFKGGPTEKHFTGPVQYYNHKNVYFPYPVPYLFSSKDPAFMNPDLLAASVRKTGGLIHNNHPTAGIDGKDQWDYEPASADVIANTEMGADVVRYEGKRYETLMETLVRGYLDRGGRTGFVGGSDTHEGKPRARTALFARALTREAVFEALCHRRNYAVSNARIVLDFRINGHCMGEEIEIEGKPRILVAVQGTDRIVEVAVVKDGAILFSRVPEKEAVRFEHVDNAFKGNSYYYLRVTQMDTDAYGNPSRAWSSPVWVKEKK